MYGRPLALELFDVTTKGKGGMHALYKGAGVEEG